MTRRIKGLALLALAGAAPTAGCSSSVGGKRQRTPACKPDQADSGGAPRHSAHTTEGHKVNAVSEAREPQHVLPMVPGNATQRPADAVADDYDAQTTHRDLTTYGECPAHVQEGDQPNVGLFEYPSHFGCTQRLHFDDALMAIHGRYVIGVARMAAQLRDPGR
jgi:hypothetical protein